MAGSVLETFFIMFDSDADDVERGARQAGKAQDDLERKIKATDTQATKLGGSFATMAKIAAGAIVATLSAGAVMRGVLSAVNEADALGEQAALLGVNIEELDAYGRATKIAGGSAEGFQSSLKILNTAAQQLAITGKSRAKPFFDELGISMTDSSGKVKNSMQLFKELAAAFEGMEANEIQGIGKKLGLDDGTIMLLQKGQREIDDLVRKQKELGVVTEENSELSSDFNDELDNTRTAFRGLFLTIGTGLLPVLSGLLRGLQKIAQWARENKTSLQAVFLTAATALAYVLVPALTASAWGFFRTGIMAFAASASVLGFAGATGVAAGALWAMMWPILAVIAVLGVLYLAYEDLMTYLDGGQSIIGDIIAAWNNFSRSLAEGILDAVDVVTEAFTGMLDFIMGVLNKITGGIRTALEYVGLASEDTTHEAVVKGKIAMDNAGSSPLTSQTSASIMRAGDSRVSKNNSVKIDKIEINTQATDAEGIAGGVNKAMVKQMNQAANDFDDGVDR